MHRTTFAFATAAFLAIAAAMPAQAGIIKNGKELNGGGANGISTQGVAAPGGLLGGEPTFTVRSIELPEMAGVIVDQRGGR